MPGNQAAGGFADLRRQEAALAKRLFAVDARYPAESPAASPEPLTEIAVTAVRAGQGHVLDTSQVVFPNGAITLVLILAESHLSIHTWPEEELISIDLFSCGAIDGQRVIRQLVGSLRLTEVSAHELTRGLPPAGPTASS